MIKLNNVTFTYRSETGGGIREIDLSIPDGQVVVLCGESGCGKTTLTRLINGLIPHYFEGELSGSVEIDGKNVSVQPLWDTARQAGSVFQNPRSQFFNVDTTSEITFGCENLGMPRADILARLERTVPALKLERLLDRSIFELSGGEKQKIACASAFMMEPQVFVLDEPSANLDADAILDLREVIAYLKSLGKTVVLSKHRLYYLRGIADRYLYMSGGLKLSRVMLQTAQLLKQLRRSGRTAYIITHDPELICECCTDIIHLEDGRIKACYLMDAYGLRRVRDFFRIGETMSC